MAATKSKKTAKKKAPAAPEQRPMLRRLKIHKFRHVEPCELVFSEGYNVLLGLNGTGKTTLLELISAALRFDFSKMKNEPFMIEYELGVRDAIVKVSVSHKAIRSAARSMARSAKMFSGHGVAYELLMTLTVLGTKVNGAFVVRANGGGIEIDSLGRKHKIGAIGANDLFDYRFMMRCWYYAFERAEIDRAGLDILWEIGTGWLNGFRFDEALGFFGSITGGDEIFAAVAVGDTDRLAPTSQDHFMFWTIGVIADRYLRDLGVAVDSVLVLDQNRFPVLLSVAMMLGFESVELRFLHTKTEVEEARPSRIFGEPKFMLRRSDGSVIPHTLLSYGQKRALALLYYLEANPHCVIADELVDGLHHAWLVEIVEALNKRQSFLASQNPLLLDYLEFDSAEKVAKSFIQCRLIKSKKGDRMSWSNLSAYDADRFFEAYQVGLQHVSEILRSKGLW
ncbi:MAG: AAA family ATPase [Byssovorax sp.]